MVGTSYDDRDVQMIENSKPRHLITIFTPWVLRSKCRRFFILNYISNSSARTEGHSGKILTDLESGDSIYHMMKVSPKSEPM